jgi:hypothetical protein
MNYTAAVAVLLLSTAWQLTSIIAAITRQTACQGAT